MKPRNHDHTHTYSLSNQLLVAMPGMSDPTFAHSVTYICEHSSEGAMGIIINMPMSLDMGDIYQQLDLETSHASAEVPVLAGGPVSVERGFVLHPTRDDQLWQSTIRVCDDISLTASRDILTALAEGRGPEHFLIALGYAGWDSEQLEQEISDNAWLTVPADQQILFGTPCEQRWQAAAKSIGIDLNLISNTAGHA
ncbi:MAG TPA: YqgE/AlgH family protein [Cellvibrionaceae bacterium]